MKKLQISLLIGIALIAFFSFKGVPASVSINSDLTSDTVPLQRIIYLDLGTGDTLDYWYDEDKQVSINRINNQPVDFYINTSTGDTVFGRGRFIVNGLVLPGTDGKWKFNDKKVKVDGNEIKIKDGKRKLKIDGDKLKMEDGNQKIKSDGKKAKIKDSAYKAKVDGESMKVKEGSTKAKYEDDMKIKDADGKIKVKEDSIKVKKNG